MYKRVRHAWDLRYRTARLNVRCLLLKFEAEISNGRGSQRPPQVEKQAGSVRPMVSLPTLKNFGSPDTFEVRQSRDKSRRFLPFLVLPRFLNSSQYANTHVLDHALLCVHGKKLISLFASQDFCSSVTKQFHIRSQRYPAIRTMSSLLPGEKAWGRGSRKVTTSGI